MRGRNDCYDTAMRRDRGHILGGGVYGIPEAARFADVPTRTARRWFVGSQHTPALLRPSIPPRDARHAISFLDLIDLLIVGRFRETGVSFQTIRRAYQILRRRFDTPHAFCHRSLFADGETILIEYLDEIGDVHLEEVVTWQHAMRPILREYLREIAYDDATELARLWTIADGITIDPERNFGKPIVDEGISSCVLYASVLGNHGDTDLVADLFGVAPSSVRHAVAFHEKLAA